MLLFFFYVHRQERLETHHFNTALLVLEYCPPFAHGNPLCKPLWVNTSLWCWSMGSETTWNGVVIFQGRNGEEKFGLWIPRRKVFSHSPLGWTVAEIFSNYSSSQSTTPVIRSGRAFAIGCRLAAKYLKNTASDWKMDKDFSLRNFVIYHPVHFARHILPHSI